MVNKTLVVGIVIGAVLVLGLCLACVALGLISDLTGLQGGNYGTP